MATFTENISKLRSIKAAMKTSLAAQNVYSGDNMTLYASAIEDVEGEPAPENLNNIKFTETQITEVPDIVKNGYYGTPAGEEFVEYGTMKGQFVNCQNLTSFSIGTPNKMFRGAPSNDITRSGMAFITNMDNAFGFCHNLTFCELPSDMTCINSVKHTFEYVPYLTCFPDVIWDGLARDTAPDYTFAVAGAYTYEPISCVSIIRLTNALSAYNTFMGTYGFFGKYNQGSYTFTPQSIESLFLPTYSCPLLANTDEPMSDRSHWAVCLDMKCPDWIWTDKENLMRFDNNRLGYLDMNVGENTPTYFNAHWPYNGMDLSVNITASNYPFVHMCLSNMSHVDGGLKVEFNPDIKDIMSDEHPDWAIGDEYTSFADLFSYMGSSDPVDITLNCSMINPAINPGFFDCWNNAVVDERPVGLINCFRKYVVKNDNGDVIGGADYVEDSILSNYDSIIYECWGVNKAGESIDSRGFSVRSLYDSSSQYNNFKIYVDGTTNYYDFRDGIISAGGWGISETEFEAVKENGIVGPIRSDAPGRESNDSWGMFPHLGVNVGTGYVNNLIINDLSPDVDVLQILKACWPSVSGNQDPYFADIRNITLKYPNGVDYINSLEDSGISEHPTLESVTIKADENTIDFTNVFGTTGFSNSSSLRTVTLPSLTSTDLGNTRGWFAGCTSLMEIYVGDYDENDPEANHTFPDSDIDMFVNHGFDNNQFTRWFHQLPESHRGSTILISMDSEMMLEGDTRNIALNKGWNIEVDF